MTTETVQGRRVDAIEHHREIRLGEGSKFCRFSYTEGREVLEFVLFPVSLLTPEQATILARELLEFADLVEMWKAGA